MLDYDSAPLKVLYLGGTGTISASCVRLSVAAGMDVTLVNRGNNAAQRELPAAVTTLTADVTDTASLLAALGDRTYDAVINFLSFDADDARRMVDVFAGRTAQYVHISSASVYAKPVHRSPITESVPAHNPLFPYANAKAETERALLESYTDKGFPATIVRPSHTYDDANPPLPGGWAAVDRLARGEEIVVHGDGTSLWTLTHSEDFAVGLIGLLGNPRTIGETFHITGDDVYTWDQIYTIVAGALGVEAKLTHLPSELFPVIAPDWFWSYEALWDIGHSAVFDNSKLRSYVPAFAPQLTFHRAARRMAQWRADHPDSTGPKPGDAEVLQRLVDAQHAIAETASGFAPKEK
ncbi:Nucleoside-diphosphate-sugar epimerase [Microlunatus soli]|uniref:Nucleoside-diphosphate-sugar epimerase n=2 Tax=Microlunatus soli TaxID=630515 RepID=A0A1H1T7H0_9ACTN|nr:Nucleoside-diphosphate-sugar epimerase [Microlunatus soli]